MPHAQLGRRDVNTGCKISRRSPAPRRAGDGRAQGTPPVRPPGGVRPGRPGAHRPPPRPRAGCPAGGTPAGHAPPPGTAERPRRPRRRQAPGARGSTSPIRHARTRPRTGRPPPVTPAGWLSGTDTDPRCRSRVRLRAGGLPHGRIGATPPPLRGAIPSADAEVPPVRRWRDAARKPAARRTVSKGSTTPSDHLVWPGWMDGDESVRGRDRRPGVRGARRELSAQAPQPVPTPSAAGSNGVGTDPPPAEGHPPPGSR
jgi:hypothetical protein